MVLGNRSLTAAAVIPALILSGCQRSGTEAPRRAESAPPPTIEEPARPAVPPPAPSPREEPAPREPARSERAPHEERELGWREMVPYYAQRMRDSGSDIASGAGALVNPSEESRRRAEVIDSAREPSLEIRRQTIGRLADGAVTARPAGATQIAKVLSGEDPLSAHLAAYLQSAGYGPLSKHANAVIDEIFNEPEIARGKVLRLQLDLRRLAESNLYDENMAKRIAYLQATLDQRIREDESAHLLRDGLIIAGTSIALGTLAGSRGMERVREELRRWAPRSNPHRVRESWERGRFGAWRLSENLKKIRLSAREVIERDLKALGASDEALLNLRLEGAPRMQFDTALFQPTDIRELRYAMVSTWETIPLGEERRIVFKLTRLERGTVYLASRPMPAAEAESLVRQIARQEGREFAQVVDDQGRISGTRVTSDEVGGATPAATGIQNEGRRRFDPAWAAAVGLGSAVPLYALYFEGYSSGKRWGEGYRSLYLESLIPPERLRDVADTSADGR